MAKPPKPQLDMFAPRTSQLAPAAAPAAPRPTIANPCPLHPSQARPCPHCDAPPPIALPPPEAMHGAADGFGGEDFPGAPFVQPKMACPRCAREYDDFDGLGVLFCPPPDGCGYCRHAARDDGRCAYCGDMRAPEPEEEARDLAAYAAPARPIVDSAGATIGAAGDIAQAMLPGLHRTPAEGADMLARRAAEGKLAGKFLLSPFSVLDARAGYWQDRKRAWLALGIQSEIGRGENLLGMSETMLELDPEKRAAKKSGRPLTFTGACDVAAADLDDTTKRILATANTGTSIFDPVLSECAYLWFSPKGGRVLDPFAGGSVRGIVAAKLGRDYTGIDLSAPQVAANEAQRAALLSPEEQARVRWVCGDSRDCQSLAPGAYDFVFSCPPYAFLERYSNDPRDLSTMGYGEFIAAYAEIIAKACAMLKPNRFAAFVVSEVRSRNPPGAYLGFEPDTMAAVREAGLLYYNRFILVNSVGSLSVRVAAQANKSRKNGASHQLVVVGCKGDPFAAAKEFGPIESEVPQRPRDAGEETKVLICGHRAHECRDPGKSGPCAHAECCDHAAAASADTNQSIFGGATIGAGVSWGAPGAECAADPAPAEPLPPPLPGAVDVESPPINASSPPLVFVGLAPRDDDDLPEEL
jgi:hypothetical protein